MGNWWVWCDDGYEGGGMGRSREMGVFKKQWEVADVNTRENLTSWSGVIKTPDHGHPLAEKVCEVIGQIGQVFTISRHPPRNYEKHRIG
jgi:hypothetical protein